MCCAASQCLMCSDSDVRGVLAVVECGKLALSVLNGCPELLHESQGIRGGRGRVKGLARIRRFLGSASSGMRMSASSWLSACGACAVAAAGAICWLWIGIVGRLRNHCCAAACGSDGAK